MTGLGMPAEPPADGVMQLLEDLRAARRELADAGRVMRLLEVARRDVPAGSHDMTRLDIETTVGEKRAEMWAAHVRTLEERARRTGLRP